MSELPPAHEKDDLLPEGHAAESPAAPLSPAVLALGFVAIKQLAAADSQQAVLKVVGRR